MKNEDMIVKMQEQFNEGLEKVPAAQKEATEIFANMAEQFSPQKNMEEMIQFQEDIMEGFQTLIDLTEEDVATDASLEKEVVFSLGKMTLVHYKPVVEASKMAKTPLMITYALINRQNMLNLQDDRSVVKALLEAGNDVYMIDWGYPTAEDKFMTIDDHVNWYMDECVDFIRNATGAKKVNLMGICQGGTFSTIYTACHQEKVNSLITLVTPIDFETNDGLLFKWGKDLKIDSMIDHYGVVPADVMNFSYLILKPLTLSFDKYVKMVPKMHDRKFLENYMIMERWTFDAPDQEGETLRQFIKDLYQGNKLVKGELVVGDYTVNLKNITCPVLMACGDADHLVPLAASEKFVEYVGSDNATYMHFKTGHIGMFTSSRSQKEIIPNITEWLAKRR